MNHEKTRNMILSALFAAMICLSTLLIRIPLPGGSGYANLGDGVLLTCATLLSPGGAVAAACIGSALADLLAGFVAYVPGTVVIKGTMALAVALLTSRHGGRRHPGKADTLWHLLAFLLAECIMAAGYLLYDGLALSYGRAAFAALPGNAVQGVVGVAVAMLLLGVQKGRPRS